MPRYTRPLPIVAVLLAAPLPAAALEATGQAAVRPGAPLGVTLTPSATVKPGANGLSLAGTKVFSGVKEDYQISDKFLASRIPVAAELPQTQFVIPLAQALVPLAAKPATAAQKAAAEAAFAAGALAAFKSNGANFNLIGKGVLDTGMASASNNAADGGLESATARATQNAVKNPKSLTTTGTSASALISASAMIPKPQSAAYAVNIDPTAVEWNSLGSRTVQLDLTGLQLQAIATGNAAAAATDVLGAAFLDGTDDVTQSQSLATNLFSLSLGVYDAGDQPATAVTDISFLGEDPEDDPDNLLAISDSEGGNGLSQVAADLASSFMVGADGTYTIGNTLDPDGDFTITMTLPGSAVDSVLYFDETQGAATEALPEPGTAALIVPMLALLRRLRGRRAAGFKSGQACSRAVW